MKGKSNPPEQPKKKQGLAKTVKNKVYFQLVVIYICYIYIYMVIDHDPPSSGGKTHPNPLCKKGS